MTVKELLFDIKISDNIEIPEELNLFMDKYGILPIINEIPKPSSGLQRFALKEIVMKTSEIYLYLSQIICQAEEANCCNARVAFDLLNNSEKIPEDLKEFALIFKTEFIDKGGIKSFMIIDFKEGKWNFGFICDTFITPPKNARFLCFV